MIRRTTEEYGAKYGKKWIIDRFIDKLGQYLKYIIYISA